MNVFFITRSILATLSKVRTGTLIETITYLYDKYFVTFRTITSIFSNYPALQFHLCGSTMNCRTFPLMHQDTDPAVK